MSRLPSNNFDQWILEDSPENSVVVSSRARVARNLPRQPFAPRANADQLQRVAREITEAVARTSTLSQFDRIEMEAISREERCYLRESYLISNDLEKGDVHRLVYIAPGRDASLMVNEEDHVRLATLVAGFRLEEARERIDRLQDDLEQHIEFAFSEDLGYLTACPTNTGTGLRLSVMMHLPALTMLEQIDLTLADLGAHGLVMRGSYGEHTENAGDLYQISNEVTLGRTEDQILEVLKVVVRQVIERELEARERLAHEWRDRLEDTVCRAVGLLATARRIDSAEAVTLLSRARLGIGQPWGVNLSHAALSQLFIQVQPAHLQSLHKEAISPHLRDLERAALLRSVFGGNDEGASRN